jgi:hypothetical protein
MTINFQDLLNDKGLKPKEKTETLSRWILNNPEKIDVLIDFAKTSKDPVKATCIESIEYATNAKPEIASLTCLEFVAGTLAEKAPRIKWESARVVGNIARLFPGYLDVAISNLLVNSEHSGTVVRWSAAYALGQIVKIKTPRNKDLIPAIEAICNREEKNSIKKIYLDALKKVKG